MPGTLSPDSAVSAPAPTPPSAPSGSVRRRAVLALVGVILVGLNLRIGITSASALFHELQHALGYGAFIASLLPTIPTLCFAVAGLAANALIRRLGVENTLVLALVLLSGGLALRGIPSTAALLVGTVIAMSGLAICNISMPVLVRQDHAHRTSFVTGMYTVMMTVGSTSAATFSVPLGHALGSPSAGLAAWSGAAIVGLLGLVPLALSSRGIRASIPGGGAPAERHGVLASLKSRKAVLITIVFSAQGFLAYAAMSWFAYILSDSGMDAAQSGVIFGISQFVSLFAGMFFLTLGSRNGARPWALAIPAASMALGMLLLLVAPVGTALISAVLLGLGLGVFPPILAIISQSGSTAAETTALSTAAQSIGYLFSALGPLSIGLLHGLTGSWVLPLSVAVVVSLLLLATGFRLGTIHRGHGPRVVIASHEAKRESPLHDGGKQD
ncbi:MULTISPECIES: MFS transporter [Arthrobacter]|uniref:MFS transporter n=2 Tax=Arthrobacter TaxID=1663 RepID=A0ABU9KPI8_9MICC|nr:MFS transporter [Arthrobacter sp. YJM1]MDP5227999.1 MFS transporter [Arthrobacter sp. YJM1]